MTMEEHTNTSADTLPELFVRQTRRLLRVMYVQAFLLVLTYVMGVWLATVMATQVAITQQEVILHVTLASALASLTIALAFLAVLQHQRDIAGLNFALFLAIVLAGVTGFLVLGDTSSGSQVAMTNLTMISSIGVGMPVTGYSIAKEARIVRANGHDKGESSSASAMAFLALLALSMTVVAGVSTRAIALASSLASLYATAVAIHFGLAAVTISLVLGVLVLSLVEGSVAGTQSPQLARQKALFAILGLAAVSLAGGAGVIAAGLVPSSGGGMSYIVMMGEAATLVYGFLILAIATPFETHPGSSGAPTGRNREG